MNNNFSLCYITYFYFYNYTIEDKILQINYAYPIYGYDATNNIIKESIKKNLPINYNMNSNAVVSLYPGDIALYLGYNANISYKKNNSSHEYLKIFYPYKNKVCWVDSTCIFKKEVDLLII